MLELTISGNFRPVIALLDSFARSQIPFALARALTWTARDARDALRDQLPQHFTIRNTRTRAGIHFRGAKKGDDPSAVVGSYDPYMARQALGGVKKPTKGDTVAVPIGARPSPEAKTSPAKWPRRMLQKKRHHLREIRGGKAMIVKVKGKGAKRESVAQWILVPQVTIPKRWPFFATVETTVAHNFQDNAHRSLQKALEAGPRR